MTAVLRCRLCERTQALAPISTCPECDGPLDVGYDLDAVRVPATAQRSMWRYASLLPYAPVDRGSPGMTPLVPARRLSNALGVELLLKLESANPTHSFKDRLAATAVAAAEAFGLQTLCCGSTGNLGEAVAARAAASGLEAVVLVPAEDLEVAPTASYGARVLAVAGIVRGLHAARARAGVAVPVGLRRRQPASRRSGRREDDRLRDRRAARGCHARRGGRAGRLGDAVREAGAGVRRGRLRRAQRWSAAAAVRGAGGWVPAARGGVGGRPAALACPSADGGAVTGDRRPRLRRAGRRRRPHVGRGDPRRRGDEIADRTALLAETTGILADSAGGVALGALIDAIRLGTIAEGERVVLVVTGTGLKPYDVVVERESTDVQRDVDSVLAALGL